MAPMDDQFINDITPPHLLTDLHIYLKGVPRPSRDPLSTSIPPADASLSLSAMDPMQSWCPGLIPYPSSSLNSSFSSNISLKHSSTFLLSGIFWMDSSSSLIISVSFQAPLHNHLILLSDLCVCRSPVLVVLTFVFIYSFYRLLLVLWYLSDFMVHIDSCYGYIYDILLWLFLDYLLLFILDINPRCMLEMIFWNWRMLMLFGYIFRVYEYLEMIFKNAFW